MKIKCKAWKKWQIHKAKNDYVYSLCKTQWYTWEQAVFAAYSLWVFWTIVTFFFFIFLFRNIKENLIPPLSQFGFVLISLNAVDPAKTPCNITITFRFWQIKSVEYATTSNMRFVHWNIFNIEACWIYSFSDSIVFPISWNHLNAHNKTFYISFINYICMLHASVYDNCP